MGKPQRGVTNRDAFHRMNFLHQAARLMLPTAPTVARNLSALAVAVARKAVLRVESRVKRAVCKRCAMPLVDGEGSSSRLRKKRLVVRCLACGFVKRYGFSKVPWGDRPEALVATFVFDGRKRDNDDTSTEVKDTRTRAERRMDKLKQRAEEKDGTVEVAVIEGESEAKVQEVEESKVGDAETVKLRVARLSLDEKPDDGCNFEPMDE